MICIHTWKKGTNNDQHGCIYTYVQTVSQGLLGEGTGTGMGGASALLLEL
jgi:hypothetical protein